MNKYKANYKDFDQFCKSFKTVEDVLRWYKANQIKWPQGLKDGNDKTFMWPNYIIKHKTGNCWDHGLFMHYFCMKHNIPHRLLYIQSFFETRDRKCCIGHCIGLYQSEDGVKFFNYMGSYADSNEFGPFKSFKEAIELYAKRYSANAYNSVWNNPEVFNVDKKCFWVVQDENEISLTYDKYYDTYKLTQNEVFDKECLPLYVKKYGAEYPRDTNIKRSIVDIGIHAVKAWISQNIGRPIFKMGLPTYETRLIGSTNESRLINDKRGSNMNKYTKRYKNFDEFCKEIKTMDELLKWYKANHIKWPDEIPGKDNNDNPMSWPDNLIRTKIGLCWDHAIFAHYFCMKHHIEHRLMHIQIAIETSNEIICIGHVITAYTDENGINFFDITGREEYSKMYGPFMSYNDAIKNYVKSYSEGIYNSISGNYEYYKMIERPFYIVLDENEISAIYDKYYNNYKISQNQIWDRSVKQLMIKKYGANYPWKTMKNPIINRSLFDIATHKISAIISKYIGKPLYDIGSPSLENGLMASTGGAVTGAYGRPFVMQVMSPTFVRPKYAVSNDILTDKILTTDDDDTLSMMDSDYLKGKAIRMFKYNKDNGPAKLNKILESIGQKVNREFIYECVTGKEMFTDDQLYIDEDFTEVDFASLSYLTENTAYSVMNKFIMSSPEYSARLRRREVCNVESVNKLKGRSSDIVIMEDANKGYFAMNKKTLNRTKYFNSISEMTIGSDIDGNVC